MGLSPASFLNLVQAGGAIAVLCLAVMAFLMGWVYTASAYKEQVTRAERAEEALRLLRETTARNTDNQQTMAELMKVIVQVTAQRQQP